MKKFICNMCGKQLDFFDEQENFCIHRNCGFGTKYDGERIELDLCCDCMDKIIDSCTVSPVVEKII